MLESASKSRLKSPEFEIEPNLKPEFAPELWPVVLSLLFPVLISALPPIDSSGTRPFPISIPAGWLPIL